MRMPYAHYFSWTYPAAVCITSQRSGCFGRHTINQFVVETMNWRIRHMSCLIVPGRTTIFAMAGGRQFNVRCEAIVGECTDVFWATNEMRKSVEWTFSYFGLGGGGNVLFQKINYPQNLLSWLAYGSYELWRFGLICVSKVLLYIPGVSELPIRKYTDHDSCHDFHTKGHEPRRICIGHHSEVALNCENWGYITCTDLDQLWLPRVGWVQLTQVWSRTCLTFFIWCSRAFSS